MANVVLKREQDAYQDLMDRYRREAQSYKKAGSNYIDQVTKYNDSFIKGSDEQVGYFDTYYQDFEPNKYVGKGAAKGQVYDANDILKNYYPVETIRGIMLVKQDSPAVAGKPPKPFSEVAPTAPKQLSATVAQVARFNQPNLTDIERNNEGLINSAFNY